MRVALYARVSTKDKGQDYTNQLRQLREFATRQGWTLVVEFCDTVSGGTGEVPWLAAEGKIPAGRHASRHD
jgi:DNA invertase Pin-like site-specific DNA recombinase